LSTENSAFLFLSLGLLIAFNCLVVSVCLAAIKKHYRGLAQEQQILISYSSETEIRVPANKISFGEGLQLAAFFLCPPMVKIESK
jgi:hypothetical protein